MKKLLLFSFDTLGLKLLLLGLLFIEPISLNGQIVYANIGINGQNYIYKIDLETCTFCPVAPSSFNIGGFDIVLLPDGNHLHISGFLLQRLEPPPSTQVVWQTTAAQFYLTGQLAPNGLVYLGGGPGLGVFDPATNTVTYLGNWPPSFDEMIEIFYINGVLHGTAYDINNNIVLVQVNVSDPSLSTIEGPLFPTFGAEGGVWNGNQGVFYSSLFQDIFFYNPQDGSSTLICDTPPFWVVAGLSFPPPGLPEYPCLTICTTNAGTLPTAGPYNTCINSTLTFPAATGVVLDANDLLRYILFTNPSDTAGSIVATSSTPSFTFNAATMQTGITYYIAAMAGNNASGSINLNDPCLDFSNALQVIWRPLPAVSFSISGGNPNLCGGECRTVVASLTGTPPFTLTYTTPAGTFSQAFSGNSGSFQVCAPVGAAPGPLLVQATALVDGWCTCQ
jgi:hypothetical protein